MCGPRAAPTPFNSLYSVHLRIHKHAGEITPQMVAWLSSIKKNLIDCGKFVLTGDMSQLSITKVDLSQMNTLEGRYFGVKISSG